MGVSPTPTPNLTSPAPQGPIPDEGFVARGGCDGQVETVVSLGLEVDTAVGKSTFTTEITRALKEALKVDYSFCDSLRRRDLEQASMPIGDVSIVEEAGKTTLEISLNDAFLSSTYLPLCFVGSCIAQSTTANKCHYAQAVISVFGGEGQDIQSIIKASVETILNDDKAFDDQLLLDGIVDVRLRDETPENRAELTPNVASPPSGSPATAAVVTVAAAGAIVLAALALRRSRRKGGYDNLDEDKAGSVGSTDGGHSHTDTLAATMGGESTTAAAI